MTLLPFQQRYFNNAKLLGEAIQAKLGIEYVVGYPTPENFTCDSTIRTFQLSIQHDAFVPGAIRAIEVEPIHLTRAILEDKLDQLVDNAIAAFRQLEGMEETHS